MKRIKKGFTLIEMLATIVLLSIIGVISYTFTFNIIMNVKKDAEVNNAKILLKVIKDKISVDNIYADNDIKNEKFFLIKDNVEYLLDKDGTKIRTNYFKYKGEPCKSCIIKISPDKNISLILEGEYQDVKKDYSGDIYDVSLILSREITSLYNELTLFKDIYVANNEITQSKRFRFENGKVYELKDDGPRIQVFRISNTSHRGYIYINESLKSEYQIETDNNNIVTINNDGNFKEEKKLNSEYSDDILELYEEIKYVANRYIKNNTISSNIYFEFNDGLINKIDPYGNTMEDNTIYMNSSIKGSGELRINTSKQYEITIYDKDDNIKNSYGNDELKREKLKFSRDVTQLFRNLERLELLAEKYSNSTNSSNYLPSKSDWLVFYYIRQLKYNSSNWNTVSGNDTSFITYVNNNGKYLKNYFTNKNSFIINNDTIDLKHMAAVLASRMYQTASGIYELLSQTTVDSVASWAGDLQTFMVNNLLPNVTDKTVNGYKKATMELLGNKNTSFNMDDIYADIDAWIIYYNLSQNKNLTIKKAFEDFYMGVSSRSYKNRFTSFKNTVLNSSNGSKSSFSNLVYKFTKQDYEVDLILFTYKEKWPLYGSHTISSTMSQGVRDGFTEWIYAKIEKE